VLLKSGLAMVHLRYNSSPPPFKGEQTGSPSPLFVFYFSLSPLPLTSHYICARFVRRILRTQDSLVVKEPARKLEKIIARTFDFGND